MPYRWLEDLTRADAAFEATGARLEEVFRAAWDATLSLMLGGASIPPEARPRQVALDAPSWEELLFALLEKVVFIKDAEGLLLAPRELALREGQGGAELHARAWGIPVEAVLDRLGTDVKAVTLHGFALGRDGGGWRATVLLDV